MSNLLAAWLGSGKELTPEVHKNIDLVVRDVLNATETVEVKLGGVQIDTEKQEAGTGYYEKRWNGLEVDANMGEIQLKNNNKQIAWGALHWQYFENLDKITS